MARDFPISDFDRMFPNEGACLDFVFSRRFSGKPCPGCGEHARFHRVSCRRCLECGRCGRQVFPTAGTVMHGSRTPLLTWFRAFFYLVQSRNSVSARELQHVLGVTYKTAWRMGHAVRGALAQPGGLLSGTVEADETYVGGKRRAKGGKRVGYNGMENKTIVFGMYERGGSVRAFPVEGTSASHLLPQIAENVEAGAAVYTDEHAPYKALPSMGYAHGFVTHKKWKWKEGDVTTNRIESFWSYFKGPIRVTHKHVSRKYMAAYLAECCWRYNGRKHSRREQFISLVSLLSSCAPHAGP